MTKRPAFGAGLGVSASASYIHTKTNADSIDDLTGISYEIGGSIPTPIPYSSVGGEYIASKVYTGHDFNIGASYSPYQIYPMPEGHFEMSYSFLLTTDDIMLQYYLENGLYEEAVTLMKENQGD